MFEGLKFWQKKEEAPTEMPQLSSMPTFPTGLDSHDPAFGGDPLSQSSFQPTSMSAMSSFSQPYAQPATSQFQQPTFSQPTQPQQSLTPRDVELILSRLDLIKSEIENLSHRISNLERNQQNGKPPRVW
ncbi:MAG TPA: hypothetical protein VK158_04005 [Acidobacteriota bacterium]|nr:hypothetical protein [Acidobacteriota bacterium]